MPVLTPADGRDFKNQAEAKASYHRGDDWMGDVMSGFRRCSCRDFSGQTVELRYNKLRYLTMTETPSVPEKRPMNEDARWLGED